MMTGLLPNGVRRSVSALVALGACLTALQAHADVPISDSARKHFSAGVACLQDPDGARYEDAYREFKAAYAESPSWKILGNIGLTSMKLERDGEAVDAYREYLRQGGKEIDADERAQVQRDYDTLIAGLVSVTLESMPAGASISDERIPVRGDRVLNQYGTLAAPLKVGIRAGHHRVTATLSGYSDQVWEFEAKPGETVSHTFQLQSTAVAAAPPPPAPVVTTPEPVVPVRTSRPVPTGVYVGAAATGALAIGGVITGVLALSKHSDYEKANDGSDPARAKDLRDSGRTLNLVTDVLLGGAVVGAAITSVLFFGRPSVESAANTRMLYPVASPRGGGVYWLSTF
jgi:hypothetical protein